MVKSENWPEIKRSNRTFESGILSMSVFDDERDGGDDVIGFRDLGLRDDI